MWLWKITIPILRKHTWKSLGMRDYDDVRNLPTNFQNKSYVRGERDRQGQATNDTINTVKC